MPEKSYLSVKPGINWSFILSVSGIFALLVAYSQTHLTEIVQSVQAAASLPDNLLKFLPALGVGLVRAAPDVFSIAALLLISGGIGHLAVNRLRRFTTFDIAALSHIEQFTLYSLIGLGLVSIGALALGMVGLFRVEALWFFLLAMAIIARGSIGAWLRLARASVHVSNWTRWDWVTAALLALLSGWILMLAISPPVAWDALTYHLVAPERYLREGRIAVQPDNAYLGFSQTIETLYGVAISLFGSDSSAGLLHWCFGLLGLAGLAGFVNRLAGRISARFTLLLLAGSFSLWSLGGIPYVDLALFGLSGCIMIVLTAWHETNDEGWLVLLGVCAGIALGVKYSSGLFLIAALASVALRSPRVFFRNLLLIGVPATLLFAPWMLRGLILWGNPVYPFVFGGVSWDAMRSASLSTSGLGMIYRGEAWQIPLLPLSATIFGMDGVFEFDFSTGPLLLTAPVLLLVARPYITPRARRLVQTALILALVMTIAWMFMAATTRIGAQTRLIIMALPVFAVAGGVAIGALARPPTRDIFRIVSGALMVGMLIVTLQISGMIRDSHVTDYLLSGERDAYLDAKLDSHITAMRRLDDLPDGSRVLILQDPRGYYCPAALSCSADLLFDNWGRWLKQGMTADSVMADYAENYDYMLLNVRGLMEWKVNADEFGAENALLPAALDQWMSPVWTADETYTLYTWQDALR